MAARYSMHRCRQGHLKTTPGRTIDLDFVANELRELFRCHDIRRIAYDPWNWDFFKPSLAREQAPPRV
jgi:phage terminase large subunit-like protein